jgi:hypothetical protein
VFHKNVLRSIPSLQAINSIGIKFVQKILRSFDLYHQERKPTSFSNCRYLELIWIIRKKKKPRFILEPLSIDLKFLQLQAFGTIVDSSQISPTEGIILKYSGILAVSELNSVSKVITIA